MADPEERADASGDAAESRVLATFLEAVAIDSPSGEERAFAEWCATRLTAVGALVRFDGSASVTGSDTGNLIAELPGTAPGLTVVLSAHLDTVEPGRGIRPVVVDGVVRSSGDTILGSDDKAGVAAILEALERVREAGEPHAAVRVLLTVQEEMGLVGAKAVSPADSAGDLCLVLDGDGPVGEVVTAAPTHHRFRATFAGRSAHAGVEPEKGVSAIAMAADAVCRMRLGRLDAETTANIGEIRGGGATNVVAPECLLTGECRSLDGERADEVKAAMDAAMRDAAGRAGGRVLVSWEKEYDGYRFAPGDPAIALVTAACRDVGIEPSLCVTGGGADANVLMSRGLPCVVLACGMTDVHSRQESLKTSDLENMVRVVTAVLRRATEW